MRIAQDWARGVAPQWKMLSVIFKRSAFDVEQASKGRLEMAQLGAEANDDFEQFLAAEASDGTLADPVDEILTDVQLQQLESEFTHLRRPVWAAYITAWRDGHRTGPDIAQFIGIKPGRARQIRMDVRQYISAMHPELAEELFQRPTESSHATAPQGDER
ncbi:MAG: hypothetical protein H7123_00970 [Thermoleophilia bacterium]|nr:hypothetical protein [Thermoleophilia bacterium]